MVAVNGVLAVIVLATSVEKQFQGKAYSYFWDREVPMVQTWASGYDTKFAFGTNTVDHKFVKAKCQAAILRQRRRLGPKPPQERPRDVVESYDCAEATRVLYLANCTGEYMGLGPVCRCQESIRFWLYSKEYAETEWFMFVDDDNYFRPEALNALLEGFDSSKPLAFVGSTGPRGFARTFKRWEHCGHHCEYRWPWAQPCILSRGALEAFRPWIDRNFMSETQKVWFGTHDVILGAALWWLSIPTMTMSMLKLNYNSKVPTGIFRHAVRNTGETAKIYEKLRDNETLSEQHLIGVEARGKVTLFRNDGASKIIQPQFAPNNNLVFPPLTCHSATSAANAIGANERTTETDNCKFLPYNFSEFRNPRLSNASTP
ncbi:hypothetical protein M885DRAFT_623741 [Pelagophyceae sp. CCMP2097]|nr:hypothetical protein M885DRAFT_623741 [Pelagophyceae sp. CCMP2097]|mmetsp:Transcript_11238/g.37497  ORF Transcript_11238/g.37497 Transcript_11238/m.37497 type:complete len:373 (+) Transcript_11238:106-1224(+)